MAELIEDSISENGAGYADQKIDNNSGVGQVSSAIKGYNPYDGTYTYKQGTKWLQSHPDFKPIDTDDDELNAINTSYNQSLSNYLVDPALKSVIYQYDPEYGGHGEDDYRDEMDQFMMEEYGKSDYDTQINTLSSEQAKFEREDNQYLLGRLIADGVPRFTGRFLFQAVGTATMVAEMTLRQFSEPIKNLYATATGNEDMRKQDSSFIQKFNDTIGMDAMSEYNDMFVKKWAELGEDTYATEAEEKAMREHPMSWKSILSHKSMVELADNMGFSAAAAATMAVAGPQAALGLGGAGLARTIGKQISDNENGDSTLQNFLPSIGAVAAIEVGKRVPGPWGKGLSMLLAGMAGATSEAEVEAIHAKQEYLDQKGQAVKADIDGRKQKISDYYTEQIKNATSEEEVMEIKQKQQDQMRVLDWEYTMTLSQAEKDIKEGQASIRWLNFAILSLSNAIQFGKLVNGGAKTFMTQVKLGLKDEAREFVDKAYEKEMRKAGWDVAKRFQVSKNKDAIKANAIDQWQRTSGKTAFEEAQKLSALDKMKLGAKMSLAEGAEEINQAAAANYGKRKAEVNTDRYYERLAGLDATNVDDYFSQVRSLEPYSKAEDGVFDALLLLSGWKKNDATKPNSTYEGWKSFAGTYGQESAWQEFTAGVLMGALGVPFLRSARFTRTTGEKNADGTLKTESHWRSPIYMQGGVYNEIRQEMKKNELANKMIERFNKLMTPEERTKMLKQFEYIAHHMQYEQDKDDASKGVFTSKDGSFRYSWNNAEDADIVKMVELFQNTGQMDLLRAMTNNMLGYQSADELRQLQKDTSNTEDNGTTTGPYSEFDLTELGENASEADKQRLAGNVAKMKKKVKKNMDKILHAIDTYDAARRDLIYESKQGLTDDQLNCLTWYKVRLAQFDKRTKEMFEKHLSDLSLFNDAMDDFASEAHDSLNKELKQLETNLAAATDATKKKEIESSIELNKTISQIVDAGLQEWQDRWTRASKVSDTLAKARILFAGNETADPIGDTPAKKPWYLPNKQWAKRVDESMSSAAYRRAALMGVLSARQTGGNESTMAGKGLLDLVIEDLALPTTGKATQVFKDKFGDDQESKEFSEALNDMRQCQAAVVRFKDLYQFYKDNPYAMTQRQKEEVIKRTVEAVTKDTNDIATALKNCKTVEEMYNVIIEQLRKGQTVEMVNATLEQLKKENNPLAIQLLKNQEYIKAFSDAADVVRKDAEKFKGFAGSTPGTGYISILKQLAIEAASKCNSIPNIHAYIEKRIGEVTASQDSFVDFVKKFIDTSDPDAIEDLKDNLDFSFPVFIFDSNGDRIKQKEGPGPQKEKSFLQVQRQLKESLKMIDAIIKERNFIKGQYSFGETMSEVEKKKQAQLSNAAFAGIEFSDSEESLVEKVVKVGNTTPSQQQQQPGQQTPPSAPTQGSQGSQGSQSPQGPTSAPQGSGGGNNGGGSSSPSGPYSPSESLDPNEVIDDPADDVAKFVSEESKKNAGNGIPSGRWWPATPFFNIAFKKMGKTIRMGNVAISNGNVTVVESSKSPFSKFFNLLNEKLNVFGFVDNVDRNDANAIQVGEEVYFIVDKMDAQSGKSQLLGLAADEIAFNGKPIVFMAVKRGNSYQVVGDMSTTDNVLTKNGMKQFYDYVKAEAGKAQTAYVHPQTAKVSSLHAGLVEIQDSENTLTNAFGSRDNVRLVVKTKGETFATNQEDKNASIRISPGRPYVLIRDNATGNDVAMPCRIAHFNAEDQKRLGKTQKWQTVERIIKDICDAAAKALDVASANTSIRNAYNQLGRYLALQGYGIHINIETYKTANGEERCLVISRPKFENNQPVPLKDDQGNIRYRADGNGEIMRDAEGKPLPFYDREFDRVPLSDPNLAATFTKHLQSKAFNPPFRLTLDMIEENGDSLTNFMNDGFITANIVNGGAVNTRGGFAEVDVANLQIDNTQAEKKKSAPSPTPVQDGTVTEYYIEDFKFEVDDSATNSISVVSVQSDGNTLKTKISDEIAKLLIPVLKETFERYYYIAPDRKTLKVFVKDDVGVKEINVEGANISMKDVDSRFEHPFDIRLFYSTEIDLTRALTDNGFQDVSDEGLLSYIEQLNNMSDDDRWSALSKLNDILSDKKYFNPFTASPGWSVIAKNRPQAGPVLRDAYESLKAAREHVASQDESSNPQPSASQQPSNPQFSAPQQQDNREGSTVKNEFNEHELKKYKRPESKKKSSPHGSFSIFTNKDAFKKKADYSLEIAALRQIVPYLTRDEAVVIVDRLIETGRKGVLAQGRFRDGIITLSRMGVQGTAFHEAFHDIFQTALAKEQQQALLADAKRISGETLDSMAEEWLADAFRDYMVDRYYPKSWTQRIKNFFRTLFHLTSSPFHKLSPICRQIFMDINRGEYHEAGKGTSLTTLKEARIREYKELGYSPAQIRTLERAKNSYSARTEEERSMLADAGISEDAFDALSYERREEVIRCL